MCTYFQILTNPVTSVRTSNRIKNGFTHSAQIIEPSRLARAHVYNYNINIALCTAAKSISEDCAKPDMDYDVSDGNSLQLYNNNILWGYRGTVTLEITIHLEDTQWEHGDMIRTLDISIRVTCMFRNMYVLIFILIINVNMFMYLRRYNFRFDVNSVIITVEYTYIQQTIDKLEKE